MVSFDIYVIFLTGDLFLLFFKNRIEQCQERDCGRGGGKDIAYRFCEKDCEDFIRQEVRQDKNQRDQQDDLTETGKQQADLCLTESHEALLAAYLKTSRKDARHIDAQRP